MSQCLKHYTVAFGQLDQRIDALLGFGGFEFEATMARPPPCFLTGQGGAYSRSARNRRSPPLPRPEQRRVDGSPFEVGRRESTRGSRAESQPHAPRACTPPSQGEKILSTRRAGQAGRRAGSGKTIPRLARDATRPSREAVRRAPPTHARLAATPRKTRGRPLTRLPSGPRDGGGESLRSRIEVRTRQVA